MAMTEEEKQEYERLLRVGKRYEETGDPSVFFPLTSQTGVPAVFTCSKCGTKFNGLLCPKGCNKQ